MVVEWLNVSGGTDDSPDWTLSHNELVREGFAWVGVSAQQIGVNSAKSTDPKRYSSLSHPGDSFSYDIFSQAGQAVRSDATRILSGLRPRRLIAAGESQSAGRLMTYIDGVQPVTHAYDGFLVHSQFGTGAPLSQAPQATYSAPVPTTIRSDLHVPVLEFETETDVANSNLTDRLFYGNPKSFRLWEVAGSSHYDYYGLEHRANRHGQRSRCDQELGGHATPGAQFVRLHHAGQQRRDSLGARCRSSLAQPVGCGRTPGTDSTRLDHQRQLTGGLRPRRLWEHPWRRSISAGGCTYRHNYRSVRRRSQFLLPFRYHGALQHDPTQQPLPGPQTVCLGLGSCDSSQRCQWISPAVGRPRAVALCTRIGHRPATELTPISESILCCPRRLLRRIGSPRIASDDHMITMPAQRSMAQRAGGSATEVADDSRAVNFSQRRLLPRFINRSPGG